MLVTSDVPVHSSSCTVRTLIQMDPSLTFQPSTTEPPLEPRHPAAFNEPAVPNARELRRPLATLAA